MRGHIRERSPGHWAIILDLNDSTGPRRRKWHSFKGTKREAQKECARLIAAMSAGTYIVPSKATLAAYLEIWLADIRSRVSPKTHLRYSELARKKYCAATRRYVAQRPATRSYLTCLRSSARKRPSQRRRTVRRNCAACSSPA